MNDQADSSKYTLSGIERPDPAPHLGQWGLMVAQILMEIANGTSDEKTAEMLARLAGKIRAQCASLTREG